MCYCLCRIVLSGTKYNKGPFLLGSSDPVNHKVICRAQPTQRWRNSWIPCILTFFDTQSLVFGLRTSEFLGTVKPKTWIQSSIPPLPNGQLFFSQTLIIANPVLSFSPHNWTLLDWHMREEPWTTIRWGASTQKKAEHTWHLYTHIITLLCWVMLNLKCPCPTNMTDQPNDAARDLLPLGREARAGGSFGKSSGTANSRFAVLWSVLHLPVVLRSFKGAFKLVDFDRLQFVSH